MRRLNPRVSEAFRLYLDCRSLDFVHFEIKKNGGKKVEHKVIPHVSGYHHLPEAGGVLDQPVWTMEMFSTFRRGEMAGAGKML